MRTYASAVPSNVTLHVHLPSYLLSVAASAGIPALSRHNSLPAVIPNARPHNYLSVRVGAWPFVLRCANLPDALSMHTSNCHLHLLSASEFWEVDKDAGVLRRRIRAPKSLQPHLIVVVDDLLGAYKGVPCKDSTVMPGRPQHRFMCRTLLLYWTGDYPAVSAVSGTHSKTCHWCRKKSSAAPEVQRRIWDGYRKYLPAGHALRSASAFNGPQEDDPPPLPRTHAEFVRGGRANEDHMRQIGLPGAREKGIFKNNLPYKETGIKEVSPLSYIPLFDMTWDILPDLMHIIPGIWNRHIFALLAGQRQPSAVKARKKNTDAENTALQQRHAACREEVKAWELSQATKDAVDKRTRSLAGAPTWIRSNLEVRTYTACLFICRHICCLPLHLPAYPHSAGISDICRHICCQ